MLNLAVYKLTNQPSRVKSPKLVQLRTRKLAQAVMQTTALNDISLVFFSQSKQYQENTLKYAMTASLSKRSFSSFIIIQSGYRVYRNKQGAGQPKNRGSNPDTATDIPRFYDVTTGFGTRPVSL
jgi:hypothetical protein